MPSFQPLVPEKRKHDLADVCSTKRMKHGDPEQLDPSSSGEGEHYWMVQWRNFQGRKHKTWEGDAILVALNDGVKATLYDTDGKPIGCGKIHPPFLNGKIYSFSGKEFELDRAITKREYLTGVWFDGNAAFVSQNSPSAANTYSSKETFKVPSFCSSLSLSRSRLPSSALIGNEIGPTDSSAATISSKKFVSPAGFNSDSRCYKGPPVALHDSDETGAVVMKQPTNEHNEMHNKKNRPLLPVVLDPMLARRMRPHQHEGVQFMYECVMGLRKHEGQGCILADEMGLGKTLQTIGLVWTLLKQNPYAGARPVISKALIVCPVSLINNWKVEFQKWLGRDRVGVTVCDKSAESAKTFANSPRQQVLIVGYEKLKTVVKEISACGVGLIICDEGHRLKSAKAKIAAVFKQLNTPRRVILSGTPIQNDLGEFHSMVDFCNPGLLDDYTTFRRVYETPILNSRAPNCTAKQLEIGQKRAAQLTSISKSFVLRREADILGRYLPPKYEYVVFVTPTMLQLALFLKLLDPNRVNEVVQGSAVDSLALMSVLTKISTSPILLKAAVDKESDGVYTDTFQRSNMHDAVTSLPENNQIDDLDMSGKLLALSRLLSTIKENTEEKCVLVSHYTSTLNILEAFCSKMNYSYLRLDGQTPSPRRQEYVDTFNRTDQKSSFIFLLSSKAGGVGINLIGASRLCLVDSDWNPSHDLQAMARCHRDGQKRPVFIYRLLTAGTIDEKIYQRQIIKLGLSDSLMGSDASKSTSKADSFTRKDLRDIFRVHPDTLSNTHDLLDCHCDGPRGDMADEAVEYDKNDDEPMLRKGFISASQVEPRQIEELEKEYLQKKKASLVTLGEWRHVNCLRVDSAEDVKDEILRRILRADQRRGSSNADLPASVIEVVSDIRRTVPGGTISFLFERRHSLSMEGGNDDIRNTGSQEAS